MLSGQRFVRRRRACWRRRFVIGGLTATISSWLPTLPVLGPIQAAHASGSSVTFSYTGASQSWTGPAGVTAIQVDASGGQGDAAFGGFGGEMRATVPVTQGQDLQVNVAGAGVGMTGGFNGGGGGGWDTSAGGAGGGASDVRFADGSGNYPLTNRLVVAGGGGGTAPNAGRVANA